MSPQPWEAERPTAELLSLLRGEDAASQTNRERNTPSRPSLRTRSSHRPWEFEPSAELLNVLRGSPARSGGPRRRRVTHSAVAAGQQPGAESGLKKGIEAFHSGVSILEVLGKGTLRRVAATNGGEWAGPCPLCGGKDRLRVWPSPPKAHPGAWCRQCETSGDTLWWATRLSGRDPATKGATAAVLREFGFLTPAAVAASQHFDPGQNDHGRCPGPMSEEELASCDPRHHPDVSGGQEREEMPVPRPEWAPRDMPLTGIFPPDLREDGDPPAACYACRGRSWWRLVRRTGCGPWTCERCHPPQPEEDRIERFSGETVQ